MTEIEPWMIECRDQRIKELEDMLAALVAKCNKLYDSREVVMRRLEVYGVGIFLKRPEDHTPCYGDSCCECGCQDDPDSCE